MYGTTEYAGEMYAGDEVGVVIPPPTRPVLVHPSSLAGLVHTGGT